jgi:hypothetical protein
MFILDMTNEPKVLWECKNCAQMNEADIVKFFSANAMKKCLVCVHCHQEFYVGIKLLGGFEANRTPERITMSSADRKQRREKLEREGFTFKYQRGNAEVGGGYAVYHKGKLIAPGREVTIEEAIELAEKQTGQRLEFRKFLNN